MRKLLIFVTACQFVFLGGLFLLTVSFNKPFDEPDPGECYCLVFCVGSDFHSPEQVAECWRSVPEGPNKFEGFVKKCIPNPQNSWCNPTYCKSETGCYLEDIVQGQEAPKGCGEGGEEDQ